MLVELRPGVPTYFALPGSPIRAQLYRLAQLLQKRVSDAKQMKFGQHVTATNQ